MASYQVEHRFGFYQGLLRHERARIEALLQKPEQLRSFVDPKALGSLWQQAQLPPEQNEEADFILYLLLILEAWLRQPTPVSATAA